MQLQHWQFASNCNVAQAAKQKKLVIRITSKSSTSANAVLQQLRPTLAELGIPDLAEMNSDKPELALLNPYEIH